VETIERNLADLKITPEDITERRAAPEPSQKVIFRVAGLYGFSAESARFPLSPTESIDSGPITIALDPEAGPAGNVGIVDFDAMSLRVTYHAHAIFPGIHTLVMSGKHDLSLLGPVRVVATDECQLAPDLSGWRALGCLDFLPGSLWAGAVGG
jgi:hypothetical protein